MADRAGEFDERGESGTAGVGEPIIECPAGGEQRHRQDITKFLFQLPCPEHPPVRSFEIAEDATLGRR